jgi:hypothetical protein
VRQDHNPGRGPAYTTPLERLHQLSRMGRQLGIAALNRVLLEAESRTGLRRGWTLGRGRCRHALP